MIESFHIIIPCKPFDEGKSRLAGVLSAADRRALCERLLATTVDLACHMVAPDHVWLVGRDAASMCARSDINYIAEPRAGLNRALFTARAAVLARHPLADILVLPIDLPQADAEAIGNAAHVAGAAAIAGDDKGEGTNLLLLRNAIAAGFRFRYGSNSMAKHIAEVQRLGGVCAVIDDPRLTFDLDEPAHFRRYISADKNYRGAA